MIILGITFVVLLAIGLPVAFTVGLSALSFFVTEQVPVQIVVQKMVSSTQSFSLLAVPFFVLAGNLMNETGITSRLIKFCNLLTGHMRGGLAQVSVLLSCLMGGISGYFGGWVDNIIMRVVDVFYCIPSMPVIIIIGAAMDAMRVDSWKRMLYLMLILGFLGWPSIARLVRGQILSLREQEFMMATEACGIKVRHRIFRHLIPNVIPQLIVTCTMSLGSTILTEATLSFLGLGVKYPFASWGNIINDVNNAYVMTNYLFIWVPAGICLLITVLGFNFVGDGLRDAFDPKMKR